MITRKSRNGVIFLSLLLMVSIWAARQNPEVVNPPTAGLDPSMDYALSNFELRYFDLEGQPALLLTSPRFTSDSATGEGHAVEPWLEIHHEGFLWNIIADEATVTNDREFIHLAGSVQLQREGELDGSWLTVNTSEVTLEVTPRIARSQQPVEVLDLASRMTATGFSVNMKNNNYELMSDVKGSYVIQ